MLHLFQIDIANVESSRRKPYVELAARRLGVSQKRLGTRQGLAALQSGNGGLAGTHSGSQVGLGQSRPQASPAQLGGNFELGSERIVFGPDLWVGEQASLELFEWDCHVISFRISTRQDIPAYISFLR
jgi:hypothetical protein